MCVCVLISPRLTPPLAAIAGTPSTAAVKQISDTRYWQPRLTCAAFYYYYFSLLLKKLSLSFDNWMNNTHSLTQQSHRICLWYKQFKQRVDVLRVTRRVFTYKKVNSRHILTHTHTRAHYNCTLHGRHTLKDFLPKKKIRKTKQAGNFGCSCRKLATGRMRNVPKGWQLSVVCHANLELAFNATI